MINELSEKMPLRTDPALRPERIVAATSCTSDIDDSVALVYFLTDNGFLYVVQVGLQSNKSKRESLVVK